MSSFFTTNNKQDGGDEDEDQDGDEDEDKDKDDH